MEIVTDLARNVIKGNIFTITVGGAFEQRTYEFGLSGTDTFGAFATYIVSSEEGTYLAQSGTLMVKSKTPDRLQGTFVMTLQHLAAGEGETILEVTNGEFDLPRLELPELGE